MTRPTLSERARYRIAPSPLVADRFRRWLGRRSAPQQAAFWAGVYLMDGQISVDTLIHGVELSIPAELEAIKPPARQVTRPTICAWCKEPLPPPKRTGRPRLHHDNCAKRAWEHNRREQARAS